MLARSHSRAGGEDQGCMAEGAACPLCHPCQYMPVSMLSKGLLGLLLPLCAPLAAAAT